MEDRENCPVCGKEFGLFELISHAEKCGKSKPSKSSKPPATHVDEDEDFKLALQLQEEEDIPSMGPAKRNIGGLEMGMSDEEFARKLVEDERKAQDKEKSENSTIQCKLCNKAPKLDDLYILDECSHKFCRSCIVEYVMKQIQTTTSLICPLKECKKDLSVRDVKDLLPKVAKKEDAFLNPTKGSGKATERLMNELKHISASHPEKNGYSAEPIDDNLYKWELRFFNFDKTDPLAQDMAKMKVKHITLHISFPPTFPFAPPFIRVIKPRFQYRTGHVTIGGSICTEALTNKGWSPVNTLEAIIVSIRAQLIEGGARLDPYGGRSEYTEAEAKEAFQRMVREHGWE